MPLQQLGVALGEFLMRPPCGLGRGGFGGGAFGELSPAEIILGIVIEHSLSPPLKVKPNIRDSRLNIG